MNLTSLSVAVVALLTLAACTTEATQAADDPKATTEAPTTTEAAATTTEAPATTETPATTEAPATTKATTKEAPTTTEEADLFTMWLLNQYATVLSVGEDMGDVGPLVAAGQFVAAAELSTEIGETFRDMYLDAPETGTELSDVTNEMLLTCATAYTMGGEALNAMDPSAVAASADEITRCADLLTQSTLLLGS